MNTITKESTKPTGDSNIIELKDHSSPASFSSEQLGTSPSPRQFHCLVDQSGTLSFTTHLPRHLRDENILPTFPQAIEMAKNIVEMTLPSPTAAAPAQVEPTQKAKIPVDVNVSKEEIERIESPFSTREAGLVSRAKNFMVTAINEFPYSTGSAAAAIIGLGYSAPYFTPAQWASELGAFTGLFVVVYHIERIRRSSTPD